MAVANSKSVASDVLVFHHNDICKVLTVSQTTLFSLAGELYAKRIIDIRTKSEVISKGGYKGADTLLDLVKMKVDNKPRILPRVFEAMQKHEALKDIVEKMENWEEDKDVQGKCLQLLKYNGMYNVSCLILLSQMLLILLDSPEMNVEMEVDKLDAVVEAMNLQRAFEELLVAILQSLGEVDLKNLKLRISWFFNAEGQITAEIQAILDELLSKTTPEDVLYFLITRKFIGYLNYELLNTFQRSVNSKEMTAAIEKYETKHNAFLQSFTFNTIIEAFKQYPKLAPASDVGLPKLTIKLNKTWEGKTSYEWEEFFQNSFTGPPQLIISSIERKCIVLT